MPFCVHPLRVLPDHLAGRAADGNQDDDAVAGDPASQMVCQVLPSLSPAWFLPAGPSHAFTAKAEVHSVCFLLDKAHLLACRGRLPRACAPRSSISRSARGRFSATTKVSHGEPSGARRRSVDAGTLVTSCVRRKPRQASSSYLELEI